MVSVPPTWQRPCVALVLVTLVSPAAAFAQEDAAETPRFRLGPVGMTPGVSLSNIGVNTNVFNTTENPQRDFTASVSPQLDSSLRLGRASLQVVSRVTYNYFRRFASERSLNTEHNAAVSVPFNRVTFSATDRYLNTRQRPGYEIDTRARHMDNRVSIGGDVRVGGRVRVGASVFRNDVRFDDAAVFLGTNLREVLNRKADGVSVGLRNDITPLTTLVLRTEVQRDRFAFSPERDADSVRVAPGVEFMTFALISGEAFVGFRKYDALGAGVPDYRGLVASVDLAYTSRATGSTRLMLQVNRDVAYSYDRAVPYYLTTGVRPTITQRITARWDVQGSGDVQWLNFNADGIALSGTKGAERVLTYGGSAGFHFASGLRMGLNVERYERHSGDVDRSAGGLRIGIGVTYGT